MEDVGGANASYLDCASLSSPFGHVYLLSLLGNCHSPFTCMFDYVLTCLSVCLCVSLSFYIFQYTYFLFSKSLLLYGLVYLSRFLSLHIFIHLFIFLPICLPILNGNNNNGNRCIHLFTVYK